MWWAPQQTQNMWFFSLLYVFQLLVHTSICNWGFVIHSLGNSSVCLLGGLWPSKDYLVRCPSPNSPTAGPLASQRALGSSQFFLCASEDPHHYLGKGICTIFPGPHLCMPYGRPHRTNNTWSLLLLQNARKTNTRDKQMTKGKHKIIINKSQCICHHPNPALVLQKAVDILKYLKIKIMALNPILSQWLRSLKKKQTKKYNEM